MESVSDFIAKFTDNFWGILNYNLCNGVIEMNKALEVL